MSSFDQGASWIKAAEVVVFFPFSPLSTLRLALALPFPAQLKEHCSFSFLQNKTFAQSGAAKEGQSNETIFVSEVQIQQVLDDNIISEDDPVIHSTSVLPTVVVDKAQDESDDEDIEVDVDGSDSEQSDTHLIPGNLK